MNRLFNIAVALVALVSSVTFAQPTYLEAGATVFNDSDSTPRLVPPVISGLASAGYIGVENVPGSLSMNAVNGTAQANTEYGFGSVSAYTSNQLMPVGSSFVSAATTSSSDALALDRLTFAWDAGFDNTQLIHAQFVFEVVLPEADPMNSGFNFDSGTTFQLQSSMRVTSVSGSVSPSFNQVNINQSHLSFTPGVSTDSLAVSVSDGATVSLTSSLILNAGAFVRANSKNPADDVLSNEIGLFSFYRVRVIVPEGVSVTSNSMHDYIGSACAADVNGDGSLNFFDVSDFLMKFQTGDLSADFNDDGLLNFLDVSAFLNAYGAGCP
ncbi:MAG: GC-type dockerin domain-anchored protein [Phycisphaerales bacterium]